MLGSSAFLGYNWRTCSPCDAHSTWSQAGVKICHVHAVEELLNGLVGELV